MQRARTLRNIILCTIPFIIVRSIITGIILYIIRFITRIITKNACNKKAPESKLIRGAFFYAVTFAFTVVFALVDSPSGLPLAKSTRKGAATKIDE